MSNSADKFAEVLNSAEKTFRERNEIYKDGWVGHGEIMNAFFPDGIILCKPEDFTRYHLFEMCVSKLNRYAKNIKFGGHKDSAHDNGIYSLILEMYDDQPTTKKGEDYETN